MLTPVLTQLVLALATAPAPAAGDAAAPRPAVSSASAAAVVEIIRFEPALPADEAAPLQRQVDVRRRQVVFF